MVWAKFDDRYSENPKLEQAGPWAELLDMRAIIYAARNETDGLITPIALAKISTGIPAPARRAAALVEVGRWVPNDPSGWRIHDFLEFNPSKAQMEADRVVSRVRQEVYRTRGLADEIKQRDGDMCRYCGEDVNWKDRRGTRGAVFEHVVPVSRGGHTTLDNLVVACRGCNSKKAGRTPDEAGMKLLAPRSDLGFIPRSVGSGREISRAPLKVIQRCNICDRLEIDCECDQDARISQADDVRIG